MEHHCAFNLIYIALGVIAEVRPDLKLDDLVAVMISIVYFDMVLIGYFL